MSLETQSLQTYERSESQMGEEGLLKKTMTTVAAMLGAWFVLIGLLSALTVFVVGKIAGSPSQVDSAALPAANDKGVPALPPPGIKSSPNRPIKSALSTKPSTEI
jgi:hypothetical protein